MKKYLYPIVGLTAGALLLAGCSSTDGAAESPAAAPSSEPTNAAPNDGQRMPGGGGVSGEIVFAQDGVLQVQDGSSQTAVRFTADTAVSEQVEIALADVTVGDCVLAIVGDDGSATTVTVSEPVDGACASVPGGGGERPDGDFPTDMPTDLPEGVEPPTDLPSGAPDGEFPGGGLGGSFVVGTVASVGGSGLTVTTDDGSSEVTIGADSTITGTREADSSSIAVGLCLTAQGTADESGGFDATQITVSQPGEEGCTTRGFGGMGGRPGGGGSG